MYMYALNLKTVNEVNLHFKIVSGLDLKLYIHYNWIFIVCKSCTRAHFNTFLFMAQWE